ncbi:Retrovirus-related Pol polyprotein from transposon TNT 1-94, partial [Bienertia sinuspersici]
TWNCLKAIFHDNKNKRAVYLENQFNHLHLSQFPDISSYCQRLKSLKDQLVNVDHGIPEQKLVLRLVAGLINTDYDTIAAMIQQSDPLPDFATTEVDVQIEDEAEATIVKILIPSSNKPPLPTIGPAHLTYQHGSSGKPSNNGFKANKLILIEPPHLLHILLAHHLLIFLFNQPPASWAQPHVAHTPKHIMPAQFHVVTP